MPVAAEIMIAPTRVVLDRSERSTELIIVNKGTEEAAYRVSLENRRMLEDGSLVEAVDLLEGEQFASDFVRFSPRRVMLGAGERQTIRVSASLSGLPTGEYRSHLRVMSAPTSAGRTLQEATSAGGDSISIELIAVRSLTIPVIVRVGELSAEVTMPEITVAPSDNDAESVLVINMQRTGTQSTYGDIRIFVDGRDEPVYFARGIAIYTPNTSRQVMLPLPDDIQNLIGDQAMRIEYVSSDPARPEVYAELVARLP
ncbi:MAG: molecular chaperone [Pseudomonadota bacterium]